MNFILPTPITDTSLVQSSAGALTQGSVAEVSYPTWTPLAEYRNNQLYIYSGVVYQCIRTHRRRAVSPATDTRFWLATVLATSYSTWASGNNYAVGDKLSRDTVHRIFQCIQTATGRTVVPELDPAYWLDIGPTNRWAMFDDSSSSRTASASPLTLTLQPGLIDSLAFVNVDGANQIDVVMKDGATTVYSSSNYIGDQAVLADWWDYYFADIIVKNNLILTGLPPFGQATLDITLTGANAVSIGALAVGKKTAIALSKYGVQVGISDYSTQSTDIYGVTTLVERPYAKRIDVNMMVENTKIDQLVKTLAAIRATPCVWFDDSSYESFTLYGLVEDWTTNFNYPTYTDMTLHLKALA